MAVSTVIGKITNLFMMILNETTADIFYDQPDIYLKCIEAGAKYLKEKPYPENNQDIKFKYGYHPEKVTNREKWWTDALRPIKPELKDHYGPGFTKKIKGIVWTLADEGNTALENMKQFISTGTCEQYEAFTKDNGPNNNDAGGQYIDDEAFDKAYSSFDFHYPKPTCVECGAPLTKEEVERYDDTCEACALDDIGRDRHYDGPDVGDLFESIIREDEELTIPERKRAYQKCLNIGNALQRAGLMDLASDLEKFVCNQSSEKEWYNVIMNGTAENFIDERTNEDWRQFLSEPLEEGTNTEKKNYIDIKGEKAPLDWDRIDDKIEKVGFGKDLYECIIRESEIKSWYEPFRDFCYQIYNGGVSQPLGLNPHYYKDICALLDELPSGGIIEKIYHEKNIPDEWVPTLEKFVKEVCELCDAVSEADFYKSCDWCGGSGTVYVTEEDEDGNEHSYHDTCDNCYGTGILSCHIDEMDDIDDAKSCLNKTAQEYWDDLDNNVLEYCDMFKAIDGGQ
jgi:hypothetical protein